MPRSRLANFPGAPGSTSRPFATTSASTSCHIRHAPPVGGGSTVKSRPARLPSSAARELGFSLDEIRTLLVLSAHHMDEMCAEVRHLAANHLGDVRAKIADLRAMERILADAVRRCDEGESARCPLIDALSKP